MGYNTYKNQYDYMQNAYEKKYQNYYIKKVNEFDSYVGIERPSYKFNNDKAVSNLTNNITKSYYDEMEKTKKRSILDRFFDAINVGQYTVQGAISGLIDNDPEQALKNVWEGLKGANPFGDDYKQGEFYFSDNLTKMNWKPDTVLGKIGKFGVGLAGDILLDPLTYVGGVGLLGATRGTGKAGQKITQGMVKSHLVEEFGEVIASKTFKDIPNAIYEEVLKRGSKNISPELLERFALKRADEAKRFLFDSVGMTEELASKIIKKSSPELKGLDLQKEAVVFANKYNELYGLTNKAQDINLSLKNLPFGDKLFPNAGTKVLSPSDALAKFGDATLAPVWHEIRASIKAGQIGKLFDTSSDIYKIAQEKPVELYNSLKHLDLVTGYNKDLISKNTDVKNIVNQLNELTPDEKKTVLDLLQDKKMFTQTMQKLKFMDSTEAKESLAQLRYAREVIKTNLDDVSKSNEMLDMLSKAEGETHFSLLEVMDTLKKQKNDILETIEINHLYKSDDLEKYLDEVISHRSQLKADLKVSNESGSIASAMKEKSLQDNMKRYEALQKEIEGKLSVFHNTKLSKNAEVKKAKLNKELDELNEKLLLETKEYDFFRKHKHANFGDILLTRISDSASAVTKVDNKPTDVIDYDKFKKLGKEIERYEAVERVLRKRIASKNHTQLDLDKFEKIQSSLPSMKKEHYSLETKIELSKQTRKVGDATHIKNPNAYKNEKLAEEIEINFAKDNPLHNRDKSEYYKVVNDISELAFGRKGMISTDVDVEDLNKLAYFIKNNDKSPDIASKLANFISMHPEKYGANIKFYSKKVEELLEYPGGFGKYYSKDMEDLRKRLLESKIVPKLPKEKPLSSPIREVFDNKFKIDSSLFEPIHSSNKPLNVSPKLTKEELYKLSKADEFRIRADKIAKETKDMSAEEVKEYFRLLENQRMFDSVRGLDSQSTNGSKLKEVYEYYGEESASKKFFKERENGVPSTVNAPLNKTLAKVPEKMKAKIESVKLMSLDLVNASSKDGPSVAKAKKTYSDRIASEYMNIHNLRGINHRFGDDDEAFILAVKRVNDEIKEEILNSPKTKELIALDYVMYKGEELSKIALRETAMDKILLNMPSKRAFKTTDGFDPNLDVVIGSVNDDVLEKMAGSVKLIARDMIMKEKVLYPDLLPGRLEKIADNYIKIYKDNIGKKSNQNKMFNEAFKGSTLESEYYSVVHSASKKSKLDKVKFNVEVIKQKVKEGMQVAFKDGKDEFSGIVSTKRVDGASGATLYSVKVGDEFHSISPGQIQKINDVDLKSYKSVVKSMKEDFIKDNKIKIDTHFNNIGEVTEKINKVTSRLDSINQSLFDKKANLLSDFDSLEESIGGVYGEMASMQKFTPLKTTPEIQEYNKLVKSAKAKVVYNNNKFIKNIEEMSSSYDLHIENTHKALKEVEEKMSNIINDKVPFEKVNEYIESTEKYNKIFATTESLETYLKESLGNFKVSEIEARDSVIKTGRLVIEDMPIDEKISKLVIRLRDEFIKIGKEEVSINKLKKEQLEAYLMDYVPHILTDDGAKFVKGSKEFDKYASAITNDFGYGRVKNPYNKSRTIKNVVGDNGEVIQHPTIEQINKYFEPKLKGKNLFSENIAEIYMTRAVKHNELMYDNHYMYNMMEKFGTRIGTEITGSYVSKEGYKAVANYGHLKDSIRKVALDKVKQAIVGVKEVDDKMFEMLMKKYVLEVCDDVGIKPSLLDNLAVPMVELNKYQVYAVQELVENVKLHDSIKLKNKFGITPENAKFIKENKGGKYTDYIRAKAKLDRETVVDLFEVNDAIVNRANQLRKAQILKDQNNFLKVFDKATYFVKLNQTTVMPSFHMRNATSNIFLQYLQIGNKAFDGKAKKMAYQMAKSDGAHEVSKTLVKYTDELGNRSVKTLGELWNEAKALGVVDSGIFATELGAQSASKGVAKSMSGKLDPTDTGNFILYKKGSEIGSRIEFMDRFMLFVAHIENGKPFREARDLVNKGMLDYGDITPFEQSVMKRIIPYYTWMKKNAGIQLSEMAMNPKKYMGISKVTHGIQGMVAPEDRAEQEFLNDFALDWIQTPFTAMSPKGRKEKVFFNPAMPYMDVSDIPVSPGDVMTSLAPRINPLLKTPVEIMANKNLFFDEKIARKGDNRLLKSADFAMSQLAPYVTAKGFAQKSGVDLALHGLNATTGIKLLSYDYDKYKQEQIQDAIQRKRKKLKN